jgi:tRNA threonylcarbamoyl adenosine modification protein (Sua5/YciO/YrdC/YwlC family)
MLLSIHPQHPQPRKIEKVIEIVSKGDIIAYPTDTGYGIGCDPFNRKTVERLFRLLSIPENKLASLLCADFKQLARYGYIGDMAYRVARRIFPGPYTLILQATKEVPRPLHGKRKEVGIRVPDHPITLAILQLLGGPILNLTARDLEGCYIDDPLEIERIYRHQIGAIIDGDLIPENPSTVVDLTGPEPDIIRVGQGSPDIFL